MATAPDQPESLFIAPGDRVSVVVWDAKPNSLPTGPNSRMAALPELTVDSGGDIFLPFVA
jgi:polysaccharide export outer membrane protein